MRRGLLPAVVVLLASCAADGVPPPQEAAPVGRQVASTIAEVAPVDAVDVLAAALGRASAAESYRFRAIVTLAVGGTTADAVMSGWVDGPDSQLTVGSGSTFVTTRVVDGIATVERDGITKPVALAEADRAPSFEMLEAIEDLAVVSPKLLAGRVAASALGASGFDDGMSGSADVTVVLTRSGELAGYTLTAVDHSWRVEVDVSGFGEHFST